MFRHFRYADAPWDFHRQQSAMHLHWRFIIFFLLVAVLVLGVRATGGTL
jgi:hypothetical protein